MTVDTYSWRYLPRRLSNECDLYFGEVLYRYNLRGIRKDEEKLMKVNVEVEIKSITKSHWQSDWWEDEDEKIKRTRR